MGDEATIPHVLGPRRGDAEQAAAFATCERARLRQLLEQHGAILLRGFEGAGVDALRALAEGVSGELMEYRDRAAHRTRLSGRVYTSADYPPHHEIFLHNESTYATSFPARLFLHCVTPAESGGQTPLADIGRVLQRLRRSTRAAFASRGVMYVRNFGDGLFGPSWQDAFQTDDPTEVDAYCRASGITAEWLAADRLRTRQVRPAIIRHPVSREPVWFNHAAALHVDTLPPRARRTVRKVFAEADYPSNSYYGDGSPIEDEVLQEICDAYRSEAVQPDWQAGDFLVVDNLRVAHGRAPFRGRREVIVAMAEPMTWDQVEVVSADDLR